MPINPRYLRLIPIEDFSSLQAVALYAINNRWIRWAMKMLGKQVNANVIQNGGFGQWNAGVTAPLAWTVTGSPVMTRVSAPASGVTTYGTSIAPDSDGDCLEQTIPVHKPSVVCMSGYLKADANAFPVIKIIHAGGAGGTQTMTYQLAADTSWKKFPNPLVGGIFCKVPFDATSVTIQLTATPAKAKVYFAEIMAGEGYLTTPFLIHPSDVTGVTKDFAVGGDLSVVGAAGVGGKLTVGGLIDPTGLQLTGQTSNPGDTGTLWRDAAAYLRAKGLWSQEVVPGDVVGLIVQQERNYPALVVEKTGTGVGALLYCLNSGTGNDIQAINWQVSKSGDIVQKGHTYPHFAVKSNMGGLWTVPADETWNAPNELQINGTLTVDGTLIINPAATRLVKTSPNGTQWEVTVDDAGVLSTTAL